MTRFLASLGNMILLLGSILEMHPFIPHND